jgi:hypothetical protein
MKSFVFSKQIILICIRGYLSPLPPYYDKLINWKQVVNSVFCLCLCFFLLQIITSIVSYLIINGNTSQGTNTSQHYQEKFFENKCYTPTYLRSNVEGIVKGVFIPDNYIISSFLSIIHLFTGKIPF